MLNFEYYSPTNFIFGKGAEECVGQQVAAASKAKKAMIVYDTDRIEKNGLLQQIRDSLKENGVESIEINGVLPNPRVALVREGIQKAREAGIDFVLAIGGGSVIDTGKAIAIGVPYEGDYLDFTTGAAEPQEALGVGVILTLAATGSEGSSCAVITNDDGIKAGVVNDMIRPKFAIMNPEMTYTVPAWHTACGSVDILAHILEAYFTDTPNVVLGDELIESIVRCVIHYAPIALAEPDNYEARANLMWCGTMANSGFFALGRMSDTAPHALGEAMGATITHGATLAVVLPAWMQYTYPTKVARYARYARKVWCIEEADDEKAAQAGIKATKDFFKSLGAPVTLQAVGIDPSKVEKLADGNYEGWYEECWTGIPGFVFELTREDRVKLFQLATVE